MTGINWKHLSQHCLKWTACETKKHVKQLWFGALDQHLAISLIHFKVQGLLTRNKFLSITNQTVIVTSQSICKSNLELQVCFSELAWFLQTGILCSTALCSWVTDMWVRSCMSVTQCRSIYCIGVSSDLFVSPSLTTVFACCYFSLLHIVSVRT